MKSALAKSILSLAAGVGIFSIPTAAKADHLRVEVREEQCAPRKVFVEAVYEDRSTQVWVEPVYRVESVPVLVNEYFETKCERVWVEPVYEVREVVRYEHGRRVVCRERVCVREGGWQNVERRVCVPAHYRHEDRQVLVCAGHFETRHERVVVAARHEHVSFGLGLGFHGRF